MKKTCQGCRALRLDVIYECILGYKLIEMKTIQVFGRWLDAPKPLEECPKPKTFPDLFFLKKKMKK